MRKPADRDLEDGLVDLTLGASFVIVGHLADLMTNLLGENTQAKPRGQHALEVFGPCNGGVASAGHRRRREPR